MTSQPTGYKQVLAATRHSRCYLTAEDQRDPGLDHKNTPLSSHVLARIAHIALQSTSSCCVWAGKIHLSLLMSHTPWEVTVCGAHAHLWLVHTSKGIPRTSEACCAGWSCWGGAAGLFKNLCCCLAITARNWKCVHISPHLHSHINTYTGVRRLLLAVYTLIYTQTAVPKNSSSNQPSARKQQ